MSKEVISKKTRNELREYFVEHHVLRSITVHFDSADIEHDDNYDANVSGERRNLIEQYYSTLDFSNSHDVKKFLNMYASVLDELNEVPEHSYSKEESSKLFQSLNKWIEKDGFLFKDGQISTNSLSETIEITSRILEPINGDYISKQLVRINEAVDTNPDLAIGTAKELIESVSKTILDERSVTYTKDDTVGDLVKKTRQVLELMPDDIDDKAKGAKSIKVMLSNLGNIAQNMAELRNLYGTGHGKSAQAKGVTPRHARLAVGAASTLVVFLYETHTERDL